jgi:hypothetical protein
MKEPEKVFPFSKTMGMHRDGDRDFRPKPVVPLDDTTDPTDIELAMLEEQIEVAKELGIEPDEVNPPAEVSDPEAHRPRERSKPA